MKNPAAVLPGAWQAVVALNNRVTRQIPGAW
jgi:hypothetical protein